METILVGLSSVQINEFQKEFSVGMSPVLENQIEVQCQIRYFCFKIQVGWIEPSWILHLLHEQENIIFC